MTKHSEAALVHVPYNWTYADETAREAATGMELEDVGKLSRQLDDNTLWMLIDHDPVTWIAIGGGAGGVGGIPLSGWIDKTAQTWTRRTQAYTNDPAAGSAIALNMTDTQGFLMGDMVNVSSSAGNENARITAVVANTSITVDVLALNHTTTTPVVTHLNCFTVATDLMVDYRKGMKIRWKDGGAYKYGVVKASSYVSVTAVTMLPNTDHTIGSSAITDNYISPIDNPEGWPDWFIYSPFINCNGSMTLTSQVVGFAKWRCSGKTVAVAVKVTGTTGGSASTAIQISLPVDALLASNSPVGSATVTDGGGALVGRCFLNAGSPDVVIAGKSDASNWGLGASRVANVYVEYEME